MKLSSSSNTQAIDKPIRPLFIIGFIITLLMLALAYFMQEYMGLLPCPLCIVQRVVVMGLAAVFFAGLVHNPSSWGKRIYGLLLTLASLAGFLVAGRHTWLQHMPEDKVPECGPGLEFWMNNLPANEVFQKVFQGSGECAVVAYRFIGLSIAEWSLVAFVLFLIYSLKVLFLGR